MPRATAVADRHIPASKPAKPVVDVLHTTTLWLVGREEGVLSLRQLAVFLTCSLLDGPHTVRGLAAGLNLSKPVITRALDRLGHFGLTRRARDPMDRRSVLVQRTLKGTRLLRELRGAMAEAAQAESAGPRGSSRGDADRGN